MMPLDTILRCVLATSLATALPLGLGEAWADDAGSARREVREPSIEPDIAACVDAFLVARGWVDTLAPPEPEAADARLTLPGVRGLCVILRHDGRVVGSGHDWPAMAGDDRMLRRAVGRALARALGDRVIGALPESARAEAGKRLAIEIEFAGRPEALVGRTLAECAARIDPGLDGIAIRRTSDGQPSWAVAYPSRMLAHNTASVPDRTMTALLVELGLPIKDLPDLVRIDPVGVFRFASLRLAQAAPEETPGLRSRGTARVRQDELDAASTIAFAERLVRRLAASLPSAGGERAEGERALVEGIGLVGDYIPVADEYRPMVAPPIDQALTAWAAATLATNEQIAPASRREAHDLAKRLVEDLAVVTSVEDSPTSSVAAMGFALCAAATLDSDKDWSEAAEDFLRVAREKLAVALRSGSANDRAIACLAATRAMQSAQRFTTINEARSRLDEAWTSAPPEQLITAFPWLVIAESRYARSTGEPVERADRARAVAELLLALQAGFGDRTAQEDLRGGFRLAGNRRASVTSQSLRPGLGLVALLAYPGFIPEEQSALYRDRGLALLRFTRELALDAEESRYVRNPRRAEGGVRNALWDSDQPVAANAMAILIAEAALHGLLSGPAAAAERPVSGGSPGLDRDAPE